MAPITIPESLELLTANWVSAVADATAAAEELGKAERDVTGLRNLEYRAKSAERDAFEALLTYRMKHRLTPTKTADQPARLGPAYRPTDLRAEDATPEKLADRIHDSR